MARKPQLNWDAARGKWRVVYQGKKYRFDGGSGKSDRAARKQAEADWKRLKAQLDQEAEQSKPHRQEYENVIAEWESVLQWCTDHDDEVTATVARSKIQELRDRLSERKPQPLGWSDRFFAGPAPLTDVNERMERFYRAEGLEPASKMSGPVPFEHTLWQDRLEAQQSRLDTVEIDDTFVANVEQFLQTKQNEVAAGQLSAGRADLLRLYLDAVMEYTGRTTPVQGINSGTLSAFRNHLLGRIAAKEISDYYGRDVLAAFKMFVRWLANNTDKLATLPKNIDDKNLGISIAKRKVQPLTTEQIDTLLKEASQRTRLYLLLGLNCAMTQIDMAELRLDEVDWDQGIITRKRSKTREHDSVPEVSYPLWPITFNRLKKERSTDKEHVLLTRDGRPLKTETVGDNGKLQKTDAVRLAIRVLAKKTGIVFSMKSLKKTSASLLRGHKDYNNLESLFLDHAPGSVAHRFYTAVPQELLNEAIAWLGRELGIVTDTE